VSAHAPEWRNQGRINAQSEQKLYLSKLGFGAHEELIPLRHGAILALSWCIKEKALLK
jgi:hypothetical protein